MIPKIQLYFQLTITHHLWPTIPPQNLLHLMVPYIAIHQTSMLSTTTHIILQPKGSLVDRGANGGLRGTDIRIIETTGCSVNIKHIDSHQITYIPIATTDTVVHTQCGPVIVILHQYTYIYHGKTIHSSGQLESFNCDVNDKSMKVTGGL